LSIAILVYLVGGFNHREKYESQWEGLSHILWKIKNDPNHQPVTLGYLLPHPELLVLINAEGHVHLQVVLVAVLRRRDEWTKPGRTQMYPLVI